MRLSVPALDNSSEYTQLTRYDLITEHGSRLMPQPAVLFRKACVSLLCAASITTFAASPATAHVGVFFGFGFPAFFPPIYFPPPVY